MSEIVCPHCAAVNRLPSDRPADKARCGSCRQKLFTGKPADADTAMFDKQIGRSAIPVVVDVWAPWCGPCRMMVPAFEQAAKELEPQARFLKLNSDDEQQAAARLGIRGIPTMILYSDGREIARQSGAMTSGQIIGWMKQNLR
jgi:thioredoxin 2